MLRSVHHLSIILSICLTTSYKVGLLRQKFMIGPMTRNVIDKDVVLFTKKEEDTIEKIISTLPKVITKLPAKDAVQILSGYFQLYDKIVKDKDSVIHDKMLELARTTNDKEAIIKLNSEVYKEKLSSITKELLQSKGLMTSRGIFERVLYYVFYDLKKSDKGRFNAGNTIDMIENKEYDCSKSPNCVLIREWCQSCSVDSLRDLYSYLSSEIHGIPWSGESVEIYTRNMPAQYKCFLFEVANYLKLKVEEVEELKVVNKAAPEELAVDGAAPEDAAIDGAAPEDSGKQGH